MNAAWIALQEETRGLLIEGLAGTVEREETAFDRLIGPLDGLVSEYRADLQHSGAGEPCVTPESAFAALPVPGGPLGMVQEPRNGNWIARLIVALPGKFRTSLTMRKGLSRSAGPGVKGHG